MKGSIYLQHLTQLTRETFLARTEGYPLILLSPRLRSRNALLAWFLGAGHESYYYALSAADATLHAFLGALVESLRDFDPRFGKQLTQGLGHHARPEELADALLADLGKAKPKPRYIIFDNLDHLELGDHVNAFFDRLVKGLPRGMQLVVNSRFLAYRPWSVLIRSQHGFALGDEQTLDGGIFDPSRPDTPHLEVYALGGGNVFVDGIPLTTWDGPLPRNLFYYFVDHPMTTRDEIFETFWPDLPTKEATNVFHVTKRKISERLGYELTAYASGFYRPSGQMAVHYDVARFESIVEDSKLRPPDDPAIWQQAIHLYRAPFLNRIEMPWMVRRREQLRLAYAEALIGLARLYSTRAETDQAISFYLRALREVPQREDLHRDLMSLYNARGERDKAIEQYHTLCTTLERTLNIPPSRPTENLYKSIVAGAH